ncbi:DUF2953 domain-containing protein [Cohnella terricola]|uniref:DUF2953 domain-containing protein n=1 Tax=Cohnella terricola TaxID=1289167 RepID=A0A559JXG1_9BACL|nr:DUF2953 domain-containing protein [Cohnella terricola]TVY04527.1 DUF2953 domain-containing protein [Cohnella terricola]
MAFWLWIALAVVILLVAGALLSRIRFRVRYSRSGRLDQLVIVIRALHGLFQYQIEMPSVVIRGWNVVYRERKEGGLAGHGNAAKNKRRIGRGTLRRHSRAYRSLLSSTRSFRRWARSSLKKVECTRWRLDFRVGTGDAATTAVMAGLLWAVSGVASGAAGQFITFRTSPCGEVSPNYSSLEFTAVWEADFQIRLFAVIWAGIRLGSNTVHIRRAIRAWRSLTTPPKEA